MPERATDQQPGEVVYVLGTPGSNVVKIGRTTNLPKRLADIQRMSPVPLVVLWTCLGGHELETNLHRHFKAIRSHGEWFSFTEDPVDLIRSAVSARPWVTAKPSRATPAPARRIHPNRTVIDLKLKRLLVPDASASSGFKEVIGTTIADVHSIADPIERFQAARAMRARFTAADQRSMILEQQAVLGLREEGRSWRAIGELLNVSGARVEQIAKRR